MNEGIPWSFALPLREVRHRGFLKMTNNKRSEGNTKLRVARLEIGKYWVSKDTFKNFQEFGELKETCISLC